MRAKLMLLVVSGGLIAAGLLVVRQQRLQAVYQMTRALDRSAADDRRLWVVRSDIAARTTPERVAVMAKALGPTRAIPQEICLDPPGATAVAAAPVDAAAPAGRTRR